MKKSKIILLSTALFSGIISSAQDLPVSSSELPVPATEFISKNFPSQTILSATKDMNSGGMVEFEVMTDKQVKIEFNQQGEWKEIESKTQEGLPILFLPESIRGYLNSRYSKEEVEKVERSPRGYEVELMNDLELKFNSKGDFISMEN